MNKIKNPETILDKWYKPRMHWKTFNREQVILAMEEYASQFKQPDISEDVRKAAEKYLTDLGIANTGMFTSMKQQIISGLKKAQEKVWGKPRCCIFEIIE